MKHAKIWTMTTLLALSGAAFAQAGGNGNGGGGGSGSGNAHGAATAGPTTNGDPASGAMSSGSTSMKMHHTAKSKAKKPMTDSTNMPGADASSDTKGQ